MIRIYESEWFGIRFDKLGIPLSICKIAEKKFYSVFYREFSKRYKKYSDFPKKWKNQKKKIANFLVEEIRRKKGGTVLSIGCGTGFIEYEILKSFSSNEIEIHAVEPADYALEFLKKEAAKFKNLYIYCGYFPEVFFKKINIDIGYAVSVDYTFSKESYINFLRKVKDFEIKEFFIISHSCYKPSLFFYSLHYVKTFLIYTGLYQIIKRKKTQFWGYSRTLNEHKNAFFKAGFKNVKIIAWPESNTYFIKGSNE